MKKYLLLIFMIIIGDRAISQNLQWAKSMGGDSVCQGFSIALDASGNIYTTGSFAGTVDFDPGADVFNLTSVNGYDIFISKSDPSGNLIWAKSVSGTGLDVGYSIAVDAGGNVYTSGTFGGTADFDPGSGSYELTSPTPFSFFILKLDGSGNFVWAKTITGTPSNYTYSTAWSLALDASGNVYTTGALLGAGDFDPGPAVHILTAAGYEDIFVLKLSSAGDFVWAKAIGGVSNDEARAVTVDVSGNVLITGSFRDMVDFDPGPEEFELTSFEGSNIFVCKLDASGNFIWAKSFGGFYPDKNGFGIATDALGNVYTTGMFGETVDFDPGPASYYLTSKGSLDIFISKLDASGNFVWAKSIGGTSMDFGDAGHCIKLDASGNIYTTGYFFGTADFNPGPGTFNLSSAGGVNDPDMFILKLDASGNFVWADRMGGNLYDNGWSIAIDPAENVYATGYFNGTADFDPGDGTYNLTSAGESDIFILKLGPQPPLAVTLLEFNGQLNDNHCLLQWKTDNEKNIAYFEIERSVDGVNFKTIGKVLAGNSAGRQTYSFTDAGIAVSTTVVYYRLKQNDMDGKYTLSFIISFDLENRATVLLYPNPVKEVASLTLTLSRPAEVAAKIIDYSGRVMILQQWRLQAGRTSLSVDMHRLPKGVYELELKGSAINERKKIIMQ